MILNNNYMYTNYYFIFYILIKFYKLNFLFNYSTYAELALGDFGD